MTHLLCRTICFLLFAVGGLHAQTNQDSTTTDDLTALQTNIDAGREELGRLDTVRQKIQRAIDAGNFIQKLDDLAWVEFPVVIPDTISNVPIAIVFDNLQLHPDYAQLEAYVSIKIPQRSVTAMTTEGSGEDGTVTAFGQTRTVKVQFRTENRDVTQIDHPVANLINNKLKPGLDQVTQFVQQYLTDDFSASIYLNNAIGRFNEEDEGSRHYNEIRETSLNSGLSVEMERIVFPSPPVPFPLAGQLPRGIGKWGPYFDFGATFGVGYEYAESRPYYRDTYEYAGQTFEAPGELSIALGFVIDFDAEKLQWVDVDIAAYLAWPTEAKGKLEIQPDGKKVIAFELNSGPISGNFNATFVLLPGSFWEIPIPPLSYSYALMQKKFLRFATEPFNFFD